MDVVVFDCYSVRPCCVLSQDSRAFTVAVQVANLHLAHRSGGAAAVEDSESRDGWAVVLDAVPSTVIPVIFTAAAAT